MHVRLSPLPTTTTTTVLLPLLQQSPVLRLSELGVSTASDYIIVPRVIVRVIRVRVLRNYSMLAFGNDPPLSGWRLFSYCM